MVVTSCSAFESLNLYSLICLLASPRREQNNESPLRGEGVIHQAMTPSGAQERMVQSKDTTHARRDHSISAARALELWL